MPLRSFITVVTSPRPRVGKTLVARLLADFHLSNGRKVEAFDINGENAALTEFMPDHAAAADVTEIHGQMALFDRLVADDGAYKIVDLGHPAFKSFFAVARQIDLAAELRRHGLATVVLFVATPDATSVETHGQLLRDLPQAAIVPVHNEILGAAQHRDKFAAPGPGSTPLHIAALAPGLRKVIERRPFNFADIRDTPLEMHMELQRWLRKIYVEFRQMELRVLLNDLERSLAIRRDRIKSSDVVGDSITGFVRNHCSVVRVYLVAEQRGGLAMWTTLFAITTIIAIAATWAAIRMEPSARKMRS